MAYHGPVTQLAHFFGIQTEYYDNENLVHKAPIETILDLLKALDPDFDGTLLNAEKIFQAKYAHVPMLPRTLICHTGVNTFAKARAEIVRLELILENKSEFVWEVPIGETHVTLTGLPHGYHQLKWSADSGSGTSFVICAPPKCFGVQKKLWGVFSPIYSFKSSKNHGIGDFGDLKGFLNLLKGYGADFFATLPILASWFDGPAYEYSPYSPASRLFWNEIYLDLNSSSNANSGLGLLSNPIFQSSTLEKELAALRALPHVQYKEVYAIKKQAIMAQFETQKSQTALQKQMADYVLANPNVLEWAKFRAVCQEVNKLPSQIPDLSLRIQKMDSSNSEVNFHVYAQMLCDQQISELVQNSGIRLYLDYPLGANSEGYDVWKYRSQFVNGVSVGCPPDELFTLGQNWGFPPMNPLKMEQDQFQYVRQTLAHHMKYASVLRIDHMMWFHRLFLIPHGKKGTEGAYVSYPFEALYAILRLESHRNQTVIVGEDLGVVPPITRHKMNEYDLNGIWVGQAEMWRNNMNEYFASIPVRSAASLNTHDLPTFESFWTDKDIEDRIKLKYLTDDGAEAEKNRRERSKQNLCNFLEANTNDEVMQKITHRLAASQANLMIVNVEDLWLEAQPQNTPGTVEERVNWKRKHAIMVDEIGKHENVQSTLKDMNSLRG